jgi:hypothetical protein
LFSTSITFPAIQSCRLVKSGENNIVSFFHGIFILRQHLQIYTIYFIYGKKNVKNAK